MKTYFLAMLLAIIIFSCERAQNKDGLKNKKSDTLTQYLKFDTSDISIGSNVWFSRHLIQMEEPNLTLDTTQKDKEVYRMLVLPTFKTPYCIRIEIDKKCKELYSIGEEYDTIHLMTIVYKDTYGAGGYGGGNIKTSLKVNMPLIDSTIADGIENFREATDRLDFWQASTDIKGSDMTDGTMLIIEGIKDGKYHIISRHVMGLEYREMDAKNYPNDMKYEELVQFCESISAFADFKGWRTNIDARESNIWKQLDKEQ